MPRLFMADAPLCGRTTLSLCIHPLVDVGLFLPLSAVTNAAVNITGELWDEHVFDSVYIPRSGVPGSCGHCVELSEEPPNHLPQWLHLNVV